MSKVDKSNVEQLISTLYRQKYFSRKIEVTEDLVEIILDSLMSEEPILRVFYFWGVHKKKHVNKFDLKALSFLEHLIGYFSEHFCCAVDMQLILANTHAEINGVQHDSIKQYSAEIQEQAMTYGWHTSYVSELWARNGISIKKVDELANRLSDEQVGDFLLAFAKKYYLGKDKLRGAKRYIAARLLEKPVFEEKYKGLIQFTAADPRLQFLQPDLQHFYIWTLHRGRSGMPWFMNSG